ncbi:gluconokinase [Janibacter cremeus]|uniref:Gluconokinase n=1 Tax=Janibacter cremeus TaxID=1285192 RepID=A0A852VLT3_9MICO|nr:gluconokinase [Janibacter cremeus]NYF98037.1 carbohydrate kinase (thermoresistant glucokinase family) [Janibacter cremeus]
MTTHVVVMGVSGSGKSTVAEGVAERLGWTFAEADEFHPQSNIDKMARGIPLDDRDRAPWLRDLGGWMAEHAAAEDDTVITCSALKRSYRDVLRRDVAALAGGHRVVFVHVHGPFEVIAGRMEGRRGHFMPESLLQSQFDTLEDLEPDEHGFVLDVRHSPQELVTEAVERILP